MSKWNECCKAWYRTQKPRNPKKGRIQETHHCPACQTPLDLIFDCDYPDHSMTAQGYGEDEGELVCKLHGIKDNEP